MSESDYQHRYWNLLKELRVHVIYLQKYAEHSDWWDKTINIFLALTSSSSIAAWAIWQRYQILWSILIASSQVIMAIKPFLPYKQRLKAVSELNNTIQEISLNCEKNWFQVAEGELTEKEIHDLYIELKNKSVEAQKKCLDKMVLPKKYKILFKAEEEADIYLRNNYHFGG